MWCVFRCGCREQAHGRSALTASCTRFSRGKLRLLKDRRTGLAVCRVQVARHYAVVRIADYVWDERAAHDGYGRPPIWAELATVHPDCPVVGQLPRRLVA